ncbi:MAG: nucleotidyl transferase AbiEii/AbiGii toxin family protein [Chlamydiales bacterium]
MIPKNFIIEWRRYAPWISDAQVEQDLIISRALIELFSSDFIAKTLAFRGGTALYKLYCSPAPRYSEDIDLVQVEATPIGEVVTEIRNILNPWLGQPKWKQGQGRFTLTYSYQSEDSPSMPMKLKIEINTREHFSVEGFTHKEFTTASTWFNGNVRILTYHLEELMGTKLRALFQRKKGRDLFDFWYVLKNHEIDITNVVKIFNHYLNKQGLQVSKAQFEQNLLEKASSPKFIDDIRDLLSPEIEPHWNLGESLSMVQNKLFPCFAPLAEDRITYVYMPLGHSKLHNNRLVNFTRTEVSKYNLSEDHLYEPLIFDKVSRKWQAQYDHDKIYEVVLFYVDGNSGKEFVSPNRRGHTRTHTKLDRAQLGGIFQVPGYFLNDWNNRVGPSGTILYWFQPIEALSPKVRKKVIDAARQKHPYNTFD